MRPTAPAAGTVELSIGAKLRSTRMAQGLTLAQIAESTGLSKGFLSRVERDDTSPSVATLVQLCQVLSLPVGALFAEPEIQLVTREEAPLVNFGGTGVTERLMSPRGESRVQLLRSTLEPGAHGGGDLYTMNCDVEVLHVLSGALTVRFADRAVRVAAGDALTFPGRTPHTWQVEDDAPAEVCWILSPAPWSGSA
ncbi:helix-turn-helix domain-containing protein [Herbiconiux sp. SYSU D00978]|uniref:helix-turn-helix domain-containing protein n=1 Tax=Herbiconiux sp. SYSU D00978 TaxID=2812562 RepID=UPI0027DB3288|nr:helix-turn-helix domain-containing protein [Herbiconiux sp. SYSU D00978]